MTWTITEVAEAMRDIDFCMLQTIAVDGSIAARPMSNNENVEFDGDSWFFATEDTTMVADINADPRVGVSYVGKGGLKGLMGAPGKFLHAEGKAELVRDKSLFEKYWDSSLERWWPEGTETPGLLLIKVAVSRVHYWDGEDEGEVIL